MRVAFAGRLGCGRRSGKIDCPAGRAPYAGSGHFVTCAGLRVVLPDGRKLRFAGEGYAGDLLQVVDEVDGFPVGEKVGEGVALIVADFEELVGRWA